MGDKVSLVGLSQSSKSLLTFLDSHGIALGHTFDIRAVEPFDGSMTVVHQGARPNLQPEGVRAVVGQQSGLIRVSNANHFRPQPQGLECKRHQVDRAF